jgi:UTP-glucose-1-phosphate uridylyltransferase
MFLRNIQRQEVGEVLLEGRPPDIVFVVHRRADVIKEHFQRACQVKNEIRKAKRKRRKYKE